MSKPLGVYSEAGRLRRVIVCKPDLAHRRLTPSNCNKLLFDDVIWVDKAREHHDEFVLAMRDYGIEVLEFQDLLADVCAFPDARKWILDNRITPSAINPIFLEDLRAYLDELDAKELARVLLGGLDLDEIPEFVGAEYRSAITPDGWSLHDWGINPLPNMQFMRDNSAWIFGGVSLNPMYYPVRQQETLLTSAVYRFHPLFKDEEFETWFGDPTEIVHPNTFLEGGDIMPIKPGLVLIGLGERSSLNAATHLAQRLFAKDAAQRVIVARIPKQRAAMHLDTIFTFCSQDVVNAYMPIIGQTPTISMRPDETKPGGIDIRRDGTMLVDTVGQALGIKLRVVRTGGDYFNIEREQWNDANNTLALEPGVVVAYQSNTETNRGLREAGIAVVEVDGSELGRGRGGSRCMTCPISRDPLYV